jgi:capsular exopolysaccharide synthesis family protein
MSVEAQSPAELRQYLGILWRRKWSVVFVTALCFGAALLYSLRQPTQYSSTATVLVHPVNLPPPASSAFATLNMLSEQRIATSSRVVALAGEELRRLDVDPAAIAVEADETEQILNFAASGFDPQSIRATAQTYATAYLNDRRQQIVDQLDAAAASVQALIVDLDAQLADAQAELARAQEAGRTSQITTLEIKLQSLSAQIDGAQRQLNDLTLAAGIPAGELLEAASPATVSGPDRTKIALLGLFVGLSLGVALAFLLERLDERVKGRTDIEAAVGAPLIAVIPHERREEDGVAFVQPFSGASEVYRALRARILFAASQRPIKTLMVTSSTHEEGKTTTAVNLAAALAEVDKRVILLSADLHRSGLDRYFEAGSHVGLSEVLKGHVAVADAVENTSIKNLFVLPSGRRVANPSELIGSPKMHAVVAELEGLAEFVVVDATPLFGASDALSVAPLVDGVLLVVDRRRSTRSTMRDAAIELRSVGASILGIVLTHSSPQFIQYADRYRDMRAAKESDGEWPTTDSVPSEHAG